MTAKTYSIGIPREDGDFAILATLNNNDGYIAPELFEGIASLIVRKLELYQDLDAVTLERQDAPDYVILEEEDQATINAAQATINAAFEADVADIVTQARDKIMNDPRFDRHKSDAIHKAINSVMDAADAIIDKARF